MKNAIMTMPNVNKLAITDKIKYYVEESLSFNTKVNYESDLRQFARWGGKLPTSAAQLLEFVTYCAEAYNPRTISRRLHTIRHWHKLRNLPDPTADKRVLQAMRGIKKVKGTKLKKATPFTKQDIILIDQKLSANGRLIDLRNNALIQIGFYGAFRRSELVAIQVEDLKLTDDGIEIFIPKSKTDQIREGSTVAIPFFNSHPCPVETLYKWLEVSQIKEGSIFRSFNKKSEINYRQLDGRQVNEIIRKIVKIYGIGDYKTYTSHSMRRGFATTASRIGASLESIMRQGRWRNVGTVIGYMEESNKFKANAAGLIDGEILQEKR